MINSFQIPLNDSLNDIQLDNLPNKYLREEFELFSVLGEMTPSNGTSKLLNTPDFELLGGSTFLNFFRKFRSVDSRYVFDCGQFSCEK